MAKKNGKPPARYLEVRKRHPKLLAAYEGFARACEEAGPLNKREQRLVKLGLAFGAQMEGAAHAAVRKGLEAGLQKADLRHAAFLSMSTVGFPNGMKFMAWIEDVLEPGKPAKKR